MQTSYHKNMHSSAKLSKISIASHSVFYFHLFPGVMEWPRLGIKHNCSMFSSFWPPYTLYLTFPWLFTQMITTCTFKHFYYWLPGPQEVLPITQSGVHPASKPDIWKANSPLKDLRKRHLLFLYHHHTLLQSTFKSLKPFCL